MRCVSAQTSLAMSRVEAWHRLQDLRMAKYYVPGVLDLDMTTETTTGVGASRRVYCKGRPPLDETVISWTEGQSFTVRLHKGSENPSPFAQATFTYRLLDAEPDTCLLQVEMAYQMPPGWWQGLLDRLVMQHLVAHTLNSIGKGMRYFYETGKSANPLVPN